MTRRLSCCKNRRAATGIDGKNRLMFAARKYVTLEATSQIILIPLDTAVMHMCCRILRPLPRGTPRALPASVFAAVRAARTAHTLAPLLARSRLAVPANSSCRFRVGTYRARQAPALRSPDRGHESVPLRRTGRSKHGPRQTWAPSARGTPGRPRATQSGQHTSKPHQLRMFRHVLHDKCRQHGHDNVRIKVPGQAALQLAPKFQAIQP